MLKQAGLGVAMGNARDEVKAAAKKVIGSNRDEGLAVFLEALGYGRPAEDSVKVRLSYSSQLLWLPPGTLKEKLVIAGPAPGRPTGMALFGYESDMWMFTVLGVAGVEPPCELAEMLSFADGLAPAHLLAAIGTGSRWPRCAGPLPGEPMA
jgi:hypothetical protein